ncbi:uncharacterized protein LOC125780383 [Bactrocera dorsalis]|uniref:Uncharacterized protein LOC125780383 n=1 Tax=Bactrocera dorsalis TaxID=27457 RepID=A0ABM3KAY4_BACDO|nr:uncharacterized protein LOC125780383 [Bactrocera dorsalis]
MAANMQPTEKCDETFKCHSNIKVPKIVICIVCESVFHEGDFNKYKSKKGLYVGKRLVVCSDHNIENITSADHARLDENAKKIIAHVKLREKEELKTCLSGSVLVDTSNPQEQLNKTVRNTDEAQLINDKVEIELLRDLNSELKSKNQLLTDLLELRKAEVNKSKSYAEILKENTKEKVMVKVPDIVIRTKNKSANKNYAQIVKNNIIANTSAQIKNVLSTKAGDIIVRCKNKEDVSRTMSVLAEKLGDNYEVDQEKLNSPKIKIFDIESDLSKKELVEDLCNRNSAVFDGDYNIVADFSSGKNKRSIILEVSPNIYLSVMTSRVVYIGYKSCRVFDAFDLSTCYNCGRANHNHKKCNNETVCLICAGNHDTRKCTSTVKRCVNCMYYNKQYNKSNCIDHEATDVSACGYLKFKYNKIIKCTDYPMSPLIPTHIGKLPVPKTSST